MTKKSIKSMTFDSVIQKYFGDDKTKYFHSSDALQTIEGIDIYIGYARRQDQRVQRVELYFGNDNGEVCLKVCSSPEELDALIKALIF